MKKKSSITSKLRNAFIAGIVVLVPIGFTLYLTLFLIKISSKLIPNEINPNNYLPFSIPGLEILLSVIFITIVGGISLSFFGKEDCSMSEGGTIPFMAMLGEKFPDAQFVITGVLGPGSNAHGPNEFLHISYAKKLTCCIASIINDFN